MMNWTDNSLFSKNSLQWPLLVSTLFLISFGLVMVASSSIDFAGESYGDPWFFAKKQAVFLVLGILVGFIVYLLPLNWWDQYSGYLLLLGIALLVLVLVPGIGKIVNGSRRWLSFGPFGIQASEVAKLSLIVFFASFLARREDLVKTKWSTFAIMILILVGTALLLLLEPDFGSCVIICFTVGVMMFMAGVPVIRFFLLAVVGIFSASLVILTSEYRRERLLSFTNPFADPYDNGYQLVQSLIAFGRGEWFGLGLGNSIQKLFFLPDAHTDFVFAIVAEEFGFFGVAALVLGFVFFISQIFRVAHRAIANSYHFGGYIALGVGAQLAAQAFVNMGVSSGLLPTKGLTLPFISYGGSSLVITCVLVALVLRANREVKHD